MSTTTTPTLADVLTQVMNAVTNILYTVASTIANNANTIATVLVMGALTYFVVRYGTRIFRNVSRLLGGLF